MDGLRLSDDERQEVCGLLGEQYAEGRLTRDEYDERSDAVWSARTRGDLAPLFVDLPVRPFAHQPVARPDGAPAWRGLGRVVVPVLVVLLVLTVITHLPLILLGVVVWLVVSHHWRRHGHWNGHRYWHGHWHGGARS